MDPGVWGPHMWKSYHYIALGYPENPSQQDRHRYKQWYTTLHHVLPCSHCADHYAQHIREHPIDPFLDSPQRLFEWTVSVHNAVNRMLKKNVQLTVDEARALYMVTGSATTKSAYLSTAAQIGAVFGLILVAVMAGRWAHKKLI